MEYTRDQLLHIVDTQLIAKDGRINGKLLRSKLFKDFRYSLMLISGCLDEKDDITHRLVWVMSGDKVAPTCIMCGARTRYQKQTQSFNKHCCPKCRQKDPTVRQKQQDTNMRRYGVKYGCIAEQSKEKQTATNIERYGVAKPFQSKTIQHKVRKNTLEKYNVVSTSLLPDVRAKQIHTRQQRYGVDFLFQSNDFQLKVKEATKVKYGGLHTTQLHCSSDTWNMLNDYDWLFTQYITQNKTTTTIAEEIGVTNTTIGNYLHKHEIFIKNIYTYSVNCIQWLTSISTQENIHIQHALNEGEYRIPGTRWKADGYCQETNTIYEFHGDYWHGNPDKYAANFVNEVSRKYMGELYQKTIERESRIKEMGYNLVIMWESDWNNN